MNLQNSFLSIEGVFVLRIFIIDEADSGHQALIKNIKINKSYV